MSDNRIILIYEAGTSVFRVVWTPDEAAYARRIEALRAWLVDHPVHTCRVQMGDAS